jgi:hypothetical protein
MDKVLKAVQLLTLILVSLVASRTSGANTTIIKDDKKHGISARNGRTRTQKFY